MQIRLTQFHLSLPGCHSLKEKRGRLARIKSRIGREAQHSILESDLQDKIDQAVISVVSLSHDSQQSEQAKAWVEQQVQQWLEGQIIDQQSQLL